MHCQRARPAAALSITAVTMCIFSTTSSTTAEQTSRMETISGTTYITIFCVLIHAVSSCFLPSKSQAQPSATSTSTKASSRSVFHHVHAAPPPPPPTPTTVRLVPLQDVLIMLSTRRPVLFLLYYCQMISRATCTQTQLFQHSVQERLIRKVASMPAPVVLAYEQDKFREGTRKAWCRVAGVKFVEPYRGGLPPEEALDAARTRG